MSRRQNALTLLVQKADAVARIIHSTYALTLCDRTENALTLLIQNADSMADVVRKADAVARVVRSTFAMTLCIRKEKYHDTPRPEGRCRGMRRP